MCYDNTNDNQLLLRFNVETIRVFHGFFFKQFVEDPEAFVYKRIHLKEKLDKNGRPAKQKSIPKAQIEKAECQTRSKEFGLSHAHKLIGWF